MTKIPEDYQAIRQSILNYYDTLIGAAKKANKKDWDECDVMIQKYEQTVRQLTSLPKHEAVDRLNELGFYFSSKLTNPLTADNFIFAQYYRNVTLFLHVLNDSFRLPTLTPFFYVSKLLIEYLKDTNGDYAEYFNDTAEYFGEFAVTREPAVSAALEDQFFHLLISLFHTMRAEIQNEDVNIRYYVARYSIYLLNLLQQHNRLGKDLLDIYQSEIIPRLDVLFLTDPNDTLAVNLEELLPFFKTLPNSQMQQRLVALAELCLNDG